LKQNFTWQVKLDVFLIDQYNNVREISTNELSSRSLLSNLVFVSSPILPKLLNFTVNPTTLSTSRTVTMQITVQRGSHFFSSGSVDFFRPNSQSAAYQAAFAPTSAPISSQNVTQYTTSITLSASEVNQAFKLAVTLYDTKGNKLVVASDQLIAGGFPGMVNVLN
jgi:hypothetical protein